MINQGLADAQNLYNSGGFSPDPYQWGMVAGFDPLRNDAIALGQESVTQNIANLDASQAALTRAMDPSVSDELKQSVMESVMPGINATFSNSGMTGSDLHQQNLAKGLATGMSGLIDNAENRAIGAAQMLPTLGQYRTDQSSYLDNLGQGRQDYEQDLINEAMLRHNQATTADQTALQNYMALTTGAGSTFGVQQSTQSGGGTGALGILGLGLQAAPLLMSDRRVKEDVQRVGTLDNGVPVYTYRYKGSEQFHMGVMADELEKVNPDAVATLPNGLQAVYYGEIK
ncbi:MAG: tail fiber domain-containing protein [Pikeienuella sp.]